MLLWNNKIYVVYFDQCLGGMLFNPGRKCAFLCFCLILQDLDAKMSIFLPYFKTLVDTKMLASTIQQEEWGAKKRRVWAQFRVSSTQLLVKIYNKCHNLIIIFLDIVIAKVPQFILKLSFDFCTDKIFKKYAFQCKEQN